MALVLLYLLLGVFLYTFQHIFGGTYSELRKKLGDKHSRTKLFFGYILVLCFTTVIWPYMFISGNK